MIRRGVEVMHAEAVRKIECWFMTGPMVNEVLVDLDPPLIEERDGFIFFEERLRFL